jgi:hypothetical protein
MFQFMRVAVLVAAVVANTATSFAQAWWFGFGRLIGENTVYDFVTASVERKVEFLMKMCNGGVCLAHADWACGFENGLENLVEDCFDAAIKNAKAWEKLGDIRRSCGRKHMVFDGGLGSKAECEKAGRVWGQK